MRRQVVRQRQEFLERKQNESVNEAIHARKEQLRAAMENATPLPSHLKKDAATLKKFVELDDDETRKLKTSIDDEYAYAGIEDPKILLTTSREASGKLMEFAKEIKLIFPNSTRINRGGISVSQLVDAARREKFSDIVVISESRGVPDTLTICHLPMGPTIVLSLHNVVTRHDIPKVGPMSEQYPHLVFENFTTPLGQRIKSILRYLFPVPRDDSTRLLSFDNVNDFISFRHHTFKKLAGGRQDVSLVEVGPRFEMRPFRIVQGTLEMEDSEVEWILHSYMNSARRRKLL